MPTGLDIEEAVTASTPDFVARLEASVWQLVAPGHSSVSLAEAIEKFLAKSEVMVSRMTKNGLRTFDARSAVLNLTILGDEMTESGLSCAILRLVLRHSTPAVRPDDVLSALTQEADLAFEVAVRVTRLAQGPLNQDGTNVGDPLDPDR